MGEPNHSLKKAGAQRVRPTHFTTGQFCKMCGSDPYMISRDPTVNLAPRGLKERDPPDLLRLRVTPGAILILLQKRKAMANEDQYLYSYPIWEVIQLIQHS